MRRVSTRLIMTLAIVLTACNGGADHGPSPTTIALFQADATYVGRNTSVTLSWRVDNPGSAGDGSPCSITRRAEHHDPEEPFPVACTGSLTEVPPAPSTATYLRYQLNALRQSFESGDAYVTQVLTIDVADPGDLLWSTQIDSGDRDYVAGVAIDGAGFPIVAGQTYGGLAGANAGSADAFVRRYTPLGNADWTRQFGFAGWDRASGVAVDANDDVVVIGDLDGCAFTRKYTPSGVEQWTRRPCMDDFSIAVTTDAANNVFTVVERTDFDFDFEDGELELRSYSAAGSERWSTRIGYYDDWVRSMATDRDGNIIVAGTYDYGYGVYVRKYDANGQFVWSYFFDGDSDYAAAGGVAVDREGDVVVVGTVEMYDGSWRDDIFVIRLSPSGTPIWTRVFGTSGNEHAGGVAVDGNGHVIVAGSTTGNLARPPVGLRDVFVRKYDANGTEVWTRQFGFNESDWARGVAVGERGVIVVAGDTFGGPSISGFVAKLAR